MAIILEQSQTGCRTSRQPSRGLTVVGLFAGVGGIERGLEQAGHESQLLCEIDTGAAQVLKARFPGRELVGDIRQLRSLPKVDLVAAGFPCQDLSQAGRTQGIEGQKSGLVQEVFKLLARKRTSPTWLLLENVPFMLQLNRGKAMRFITDSLEAMGFTWAYRVVDARAFGLPQRRQRVLLLASRTGDPRKVLFSGQVPEPKPLAHETVACGFYWTEGIRGLGWAVDAVPTLKGGSTIGIPSPPAIRLPNGGGIVTPDIRDAERLQGFPADWTLPAVESGACKRGGRWRLVGNAVSVRMAKWIGERLNEGSDTYDSTGEERLSQGSSWPKAAWGSKGKGAFSLPLSMWPVHEEQEHLVDFLEYPTKQLSEKATAGFLGRTDVSTLRFPGGFLDEVRGHLSRLQGVTPLSP